MKKLWIIGAALAFCMVMIAVASGSQGAGRTDAGGTEQHSPGPTERASGPALVKAEAAALERSGLSAAAAEREIEAQSAIAEAELVPRLEASLGNAFGGVWLEPSTAQLHVGVTSEAGRQAGEAVAARAGLAPQVVETSVRSTWDELLKEQLTLNSRLADLLARGAITTSVLPQANAIKVTESSALSSAEKEGVQRQASSASVDVKLVPTSYPHFGIARQARCRAFTSGKAYCDPTLAAGTSLEKPSLGRCTVGPALLKKNPGNDTTETFILTAGHCIGAANEVFSSYVKGEVTQQIGKSIISLLPPVDHADVGVIKVENAEWIHAGQIPVNPTVASWEPAESDPSPVLGEQNRWSTRQPVTPARPPGPSAAGSKK